MAECAWASLILTSFTDVRCLVCVEPKYLYWSTSSSVCPFIYMLVDGFGQSCIIYSSGFGLMLLTRVRGWQVRFLLFNSVLWRRCSRLLSANDLLSPPSRRYIPTYSRLKRMNGLFTCVYLNPWSLLCVWYRSWVTQLWLFNRHMSTQCRIRQETPTRCGTKDADVLDTFLSRQTLMRMHWIFWCICNYYDITTPINSKCCSICYLWV